MSILNLKPNKVNQVNPESRFVSNILQIKIFLTQQSLHVKTFDIPGDIGSAVNFSKKYGGGVKIKIKL